MLALASEARKHRSGWRLLVDGCQATDLRLRAGARVNRHGCVSSRTLAASRSTIRTRKLSFLPFRTTKQLRLRIASAGIKPRLLIRNAADRSRMIPPPRMRRVASLLDAVTPG